MATLRAAALLCLWACGSAACGQSVTAARRSPQPAATTYGAFEAPAAFAAEGSTAPDGEQPFEQSLSEEPAAEIDFGCCGCCRRPPLFGFVAPSDRCFRGFISPQTNPLFFEDPRTLTEVRFHFVEHFVPDDNVLFQGGDAQYIAAQLRVALSERLSFIATKDGYIWLQPDNPALDDTDGFADAAAGLKYNLLRDPSSQTILSAGFTFEIPFGTEKVFQGSGDGEFHVFLCGGQELAPGIRWLTGTGFRLPTDDEVRSTMWYWSNQLSRQLSDRLYAVAECNWFHWTESGEALPGIDFEGGDLFNLGAGDVAGNDVVTLGVGARYKPNCLDEFGVAYEFTVSEREDLMEGRVYVDYALRY